MARRRPPDWAAVLRALHGEPIHLSPAERLIAVAVLSRTLSAAEIADRLGFTQRTVVRWRAKNRIHPVDRFELVS